MPDALADRVPVGKPGRILVPVDFSSGSAVALRYGVKLARALQAQLCIVHVWRNPISLWEGGLGVPRSVTRELESAARAELDATLAKTRSEYPRVDARFYLGDPRDGILKAARDCHADAIVIATHGRSGLTRVLVGSVAEHVLRHATCPVLTLSRAAIHA
ncbi:MAG: universal stress protein [Polyangiales bacterium]